MKKGIVLSSLFATVIAVFAVGVITFGCSVDGFYGEPDPEITTSTELEDYIIVATDLDQSLKQFEKELNKIDFRTLETVVEDGVEVTRLPENVRRIDIDGKLRSMNESKAALHRRFPKFLLLSKKEAMRHFDRSIQRSERVAGKLLEFGYDFTIPVLKTRYETEFGQGGENMSEMMWLLYNWCQQPDDTFVELSIIKFVDGRIYVTSSGNSSWQANFALAHNAKYPGKWFYPDSSSPNNQVVGIAHTHTYNAVLTDADYGLKTAYPGLSYEIYYNGAFRSY